MAGAAAPAALREPVLGIQEDLQGSLWLATSTHVLRANRDKLLRGNLNEGDLREYGIDDGLRGSQGVRRCRSTVADPAARIWFSLDGGFSVVDPARLKRDTPPAIVQIQTLSADGKTVPLQGKLHVSGKTQRITFGYAGLSLSVPGRVRFRYRLDNFDSGWSDPVSLREAAYTNLSPGSYRFRVIASNPDGVWNSNEGAILFDVEPLYWQSWWFRAAILLARVLSCCFIEFGCGALPTASGCDSRNVLPNVRESPRSCTILCCKGF